MATDVDVMNIAASKLGETRINSRLDDVKFAEEVNARYESIRDAELRRNTWRFSIKRAELSALSSTPMGDQFTLEYQLPSDCLRLIQVAEWYEASLTDYRGTDESPYSLESGKILTTYPAPLFIRYVRRVENASEFDSAFIEALGARIAYELAETITGSGSKKQDCFRDYRQALNEAQAANAIEVAPQVATDESWIIARLAGNP